MDLDFHDLTLKMQNKFLGGQTPNLNLTFGLEILPHKAWENREGDNVPFKLSDNTGIEKCCIPY